MKRKFLEDMGLTKEQVDQIMDENGKDINKEKANATALNNQLADVQAKLKTFDGVDVNDLRNQITTLTNNMAKQKTDYENQIADRDFTDNLKSKITGMKARNAKAVMALLDIEALKKSKNQDNDIALALEAVKKDNDYLFEAGTTQPTTQRRVVTGNTSTTEQVDKKTAANEAIRSLFN